jgi:hypothetical protein
MKLILTTRTKLERHIHLGSLHFITKKKFRGRKMKLYPISQIMFALEAMSGPKDRYFCA